MSGDGSPSLRVRRMPGRYAIARLDAEAALPQWAETGPPGVISITRTPDECSVLAPEQRVPPDVRAERGFAAFMVEGPLDFALTGVLAQLTARLADAGIPVFVISTFDTDWLFVRETHAEAAGVVLGDVRQT